MWPRMAMVAHRAGHRSSLLRQFSSSPPKITVTADGSTFVALHPEKDYKDFPYELSKPLTTVASPVETSPLKNASSEVLSLLKCERKDEAVKRLAAMTLTCPHKWYPIGRKKRIQMQFGKQIKPDRTYL